eukprot:gene12936-17343_t
MSWNQKKDYIPVLSKCNLVTVIPIQNPAYQDQIEYITPTNGIEVQNISTFPSYNEDQVIRICSISDTHGEHDALTKIPPCDILIHCGDIFFKSRHFPYARGVQKLKEFNEWLSNQPAKHRLVIGGNHDHILEIIPIHQIEEILTNATYLCNTMVCLMGLKIFGSPISRGIGSNNKAFQSKLFRKLTFESLMVNKIWRNSKSYFNATNSDSEDNFDDVDEIKIEEIYNSIDILITHGTNQELSNIVRPNIVHFWGHMHEMHGASWVTSEGNLIDQTLIKQGFEIHHPSQNKKWLSVCSSLLNDHYIPTNNPIVVDIVKR